MTCGIARRNGMHVCKSEIKTFAVKRIIDGCEGHLTVCEYEMRRLIELGAFKLIKEVTQ